MLVSVVLVIFGAWIRLGIEETRMFKQLEQSGMKAKAPIGEVMRSHWRSLAIGGGVRVGTDVVYVLVAVFSLTYVTTILGLSRTLGLTAIMIGTVFNATAMPLCGALSDRLGRRPVYAAGAILGIVWGFAFFFMYDTRNPLAIVAAVVTGYLIHAMMYGPQAALIIEQFPTRVRYAGSSLAYTMAGIVGAGFAPLIMARLYQVYRTTLAISIYVVIALLVTLISLAAARETAKSGMET
jgi:MFS family permease